MINYHFLFNVLRVLVDRPENQTRFVILGSTSPDPIKKVSETLASKWVLDIQYQEKYCYDNVVKNFVDSQNDL